MEGFFLNDNKLSSHMAQISEHINYTNHNIHFYGQMEKMIVNLGIWEGENNNSSSPQLSRIQNSLIMSIFDTPEKYLYNVEGKYDTRKVRTS